MPTTFSSARMRAITGVLAALLLLLSGIGLPSAQARAALATPTGLSPDSVTVDAIPVLSWDRDLLATSYSVEMSTSSSFDTTFWTLSTTNHQAVPVKQLPATTIYWRVRATAGSSVSPWATATIERSALAGPTPVTPEDGTVLRQPQEPVLMTWTPVTGAKEYVVDWSTDSSFADDGLKETATIKTTSIVVPAQVAQTYYWRVRATFDTGIYSQWSETRSYEIGGLAKPVLTGPDDSPFTDVEDIVLDWEPVLGAKTYNLQVSTDHNFAVGNVDLDIPNITGTRYSPPITLANDQYYWRVQPVDSSGNKLDWNSVDTWTFRRHWPDQPGLVYPTSNQTVTGPLYFQWTPVHLASGYELQVSANSSFDNIASITVGKGTDHTTYVPSAKWLPVGASGGSYYWRVVAIDAPGKTSDGDVIVTDAISAEIGHFTWAPTKEQKISPAPGGSLEIPTLAWNPVPGAYSYQVTITAVDGGIGGGTYTTYANSYTPRSLLSAGDEYRWDVQTKSASGVLGPSLLQGSQPTFTVAASTATPGATPEPAGTPAPSSRFPTLTWSPVTDATRYRVLVRPQGTGGFTALADYFVYTAGEDDTLSYLSPGTYEWMVEAYQGSVYKSASTAIGTFQITALPSVTGEHVGITGMAVNEPSTSCATALPERCMDLRQTPVLAWDPIDEAAFYKVWISRDEQMTNIVSGYPQKTENNLFLSINSLVDSQAGSAFYWFVQPCKADTACGPLNHAGHAFNKLSKAVQPISPVEDEVLANDITFTWRDYLETSQDPTAFPSDEPTGVNDVDPTLEAQQYRIQVSADANFQTTLINKVVDQTTFTAFDNTFPEGRLYWRVQAIDGSDNNLTWSQPVSFTKNSPTVVLTEPTNQMHASGSVPLRWEPLAFAASYDVEVYRNGDTTGSAVNLVDDGNTTQAAISWTTPMSTSATFYTWRVRPVDAKGKPGRWTDLADPEARFFVDGETPVLSDPADGVYVHANNALFTWQPAAGATSYKFERKLVGASSAAEAVTTPALAWAPKSAMGDGSWQWRVSSLDAAGKVLGSTAWRGFLVDSTPPEITSYTPKTTAKKTANFVVKFSEPVSSVHGNSFALRVKGSTTKLLSTVTLNAAGTKATLNPAVDLKVGKSYTLTLNRGVRDPAGNRLAVFTWTVKAK